MNLDFKLQAVKRDPPFDPGGSDATAAALLRLGMDSVLECIEGRTETPDRWRDAWRDAPPAAKSRIDDGGTQRDLLGVRIGGQFPAVAMVPHGAPSDGITVLAAASISQALDCQPGAMLDIEVRKRMDLHAVIFDVDGTLVDSLHAYFRLAQQTALAHGFDTDWPTLRRAIDDNRLDFWNLIVPPHVADRDQVMTRLSTHAKTIWPRILGEHVCLMNATQSLIQTLATRGHKLGIVTASAGGSMLPLRQSNLDAHFGAIVTRNDVQRRKPHPEGIHRVIESLGADPDQTAYVGDSIMDVRAARAAGVHAVGVLGGASNAARLMMESPDHILPNAGAVLDWIAN